MYIEWLIATGLTCILTILAGYMLIPVLRSHKVGQVIYELGPSWHKSKQYTPTMGGICFILSSLLVMAGFFVREALIGRDTTGWIPLASTLCLAVGNGLIGFIDDYTKLVKKQNQGLTPPQKLFLQLAVAAAYVFIMVKSGYMFTSFIIPYFDILIDLGWLFYPIAIVLIAGIVNSVNISDGIDGLASSLSGVAGAFFIVVAAVYGGRQLGLCGAVMIGAMLGFLLFNRHPACVFMGDTGSLFLGGMIIGVGFMINQPLILILAAFVFVIEMLSSLTQVLYFKLTHGKRLFKMAPLHHHFEMSGWGENKIVRVFSLVALICGVLAFIGLDGIYIL